MGSCRTIPVNPLGMARARVRSIRRTSEVVIACGSVATASSLDHLLSLLMIKVFEKIALLSLIIRHIEGVSCEVLLLLSAVEVFNYG